MVTPSPFRVRIAHLQDDLADRVNGLREDHEAVIKSRRRLERALEGGRTIYGVNTGFGSLATERIPMGKQRELQRNLLLSHAVGVGKPIDPVLTKLMLRLKIHALGLGYSGISVGTFKRLLDLDEHGVLAVVPSKGSVGASGDLAPLAHLALPLVGIGEVWGESGRRSAAEALAEAGLSPQELQAKDGLALLNGTQFMGAHAAYILHESLRLERLADLIAAMSLEALQGSIRPFDPRIHEVRPHPGQIAVAANIRSLLEKSEILESHRDCGKVQDPYSLRCIPQVHGASRDALRYAREVTEIEINSATDNPLVFEGNEVISGGNFHGQPLALAMDHAAVALAEFASISERRLYLLLGGHDGLPRLLMRETGLNSGFMLPQYTAAALVSENKVLCHPASVDSIPTSLGQEDHVSMGAVAALKLLSVLRNVERVLAIELVAASQALDYRRPLEPGRGVEAAHQTVRARIPHREADYLFQEDLTPALELVRCEDLLEAAASARGAMN